MKAKHYLICSFILLLFAPLSGMAQVDFDNMHGVRWKPKLPKRDVIWSKAPYVPTGQTNSWSSNIILDSIGANYSSIDLTPASKLIKDTDGTSCQNLSPTSSCVLQWKAAQYDSVAQFIKDSPIDKWMLHARVTPDASKTISGSGAVDYANDMIEVIKRVKTLGVQDKVRGIMIGEHETEGREMLTLALTIIDSINAHDFNGSNLSGGKNWLRTKAVTLHGGGFGAKFQNIHWKVKDYDQTLSGDQNFLKELSDNQKCADFAFAFKLFKGNMNFTSIPLTTSEWKTLLYNGSVTSSGTTISYDFKLKHVDSLFSNSTYNGGVSTNFKNIIFVGDDADGTTNMWKDPKTKKSFWALRSIFDEKNWNGFVFGVPLSAKINKQVEIINDDGTENTIVFGGGGTSLSHWQSWKANMINDPTNLTFNINQLPQGMDTENTKDIYEPLVLYPNPTKENHVYLNINGSSSFNLSIYDQKGVKINSRITNEGNKLKIDTQNLPSGLYYINGTINNVAISKKMIVDRY
ncbi:T9SS type A sorting domain-containing protein [Flagellimonas sp. MMG031]|uniref:T9SS type A sorting domain-containing protein n=1 Tax=Flagellimonas sp. MMG031 TaxID=3158549 RepID=A0AAU7MWM4_9FLAO